MDIVISVVEVGLAISKAEVRVISVAEVKISVSVAEVVVAVSVAEAGGFNRDYSRCEHICSRGRNICICSRGGGSCVCSRSEKIEGTLMSL